MTVSRVVSAAMLVCGLATNARAQESQIKLATVEVHHFLSKEVIVTDSRGRRASTAQLTPALRFNMPIDTQARIIVVDPNPLLFVYSKGTFTTANTANYEALAAFAKSLEPISGGLGKTANVKLSEKIAAFLQKGASVSEAPAELPPFDKINIGTFTDLGNHLTALRDIAAKVPAIVEKSATAPGEARSDALAEESGLAEHADAAEKIFADLDGAAGQILERFGDSRVVEHPLLPAFTLARQGKADALALIKTLRQFEKDAHGILEPIDLGTTGYDSAKDQIAAFEITPRKDTKDTNQAAHASGAFTATFVPQSAVALAVFAGVVYIHIVGDDGLTKTNIAALLTATPHALSTAGMSMGLQVGVTGDSRGLGMLLGVSATLYDRLGVGGGFAYQDIATTGRNYKPGWYVQLVIDLAKKQ